MNDKLLKIFLNVYLWLQYVMVVLNILSIRIIIPLIIGVFWGLGEEAIRSNPTNAFLPLCITLAAITIYTALFISLIKTVKVTKKRLDKIPLTSHEKFIIYS